MAGTSILLPAQMRSIASLADAVAFDLRGAGFSAGATTIFADNLRRSAAHNEKAEGDDG